MAAESANDGRQPNRLEKKTNMSQGVPGRSRYMR